MDVLKTLLNLCEVNSLSGNEDEIDIFLEKELKKYSKNIIKTPTKSIILKLNENENKKPKIMLEAHLDCVGMIVKSITKDGFLEILNCGGLDLKMLISKEVLVLGKKPLTGFIFKNLDEKEKKLKIENLLVDVNLNEEKAKELINVGDSIVFKYNPVILKDDKVSVRSLDDRASIAAIFLVLEKLKEKDLNCEILVCFSSQEETTQMGAKTATFLETPDIAISVDVSFAKTLNCKEGSIGEMNKGPLIGISPILDKNLTNKLIEIAKEKNIPFQLEIMNGKTHTNADEIATTKSGVKTVLCSIPIKNMHTPIETIKISDIKNTAELIYHFIISSKEV